MKTATVRLAGRTFVVTAFPWRDLEKLMALHLGLQKALEARPVDIVALLNFRTALAEFLYASVRRAQPEVTLEDFADLDPDILMGAIAAAIQISAPAKRARSHFMGFCQN